MEGYSNNDDHQEYIFWNPYNEVVQDHRDGTIDYDLTNKKRKELNMPPLHP